MTSPSLQRNTGGLQWGPTSETVKVAPPPGPPAWPQFPRSWNQPSLLHLAAWCLPSHSHEAGRNSEHSWSLRAPHAPVPIHSHTLSAHQSRLRRSAAGLTRDWQILPSRSILLAWWQVSAKHHGNGACARLQVFSSNGSILLPNNRTPTFYVGPGSPRQYYQGPRESAKWNV